MLALMPISTTTHSSARQLAFLTLRSIQQGAFADVALDKILNQTALPLPDRRLLTELVYGTVRRQRTLDALIDQFAKKRSSQQPPDLRLILHLGLYQLRYLNQIPASAAVNTTVDLTKQNGLAGLTGFVNGLLRQYLRAAEMGVDPLPRSDNPVEQLGIQHSYPNWMIEVWRQQLDLAETAQLCEWLNQPPHLDLRVNPLRTSLEQVETALRSAGISVDRILYLPQALRLAGATGAVQNLPGFNQGWWMVQDSSAQLVSHLVDPQPGEVIVDACAAPGGKTAHLAELMQNQGTIWAIDRAPSRLKKLQQNADRLELQTIQICAGDSRELPQFVGQCDRVLLDAPCSGLGTLNRHADARWRQTPATVAALSQLQQELLHHTATWVKPNGVLVYATCTLHPAENETVIQTFLTTHPNWTIAPPAPNSNLATFAEPQGWLKVWSHRQNMDGFFMVRLQRSEGDDRTVAL
jgi:16S rRNA (cytosine967-C5)-methyltransferase